MDGLYLKLALTLLLSIFIAYKFFLRKKHNYPPGPRALPIIGNLHLIKPGPLYLYYETVSKRLGPILLFWMGKVPVMVISSPEAFEECFTKNDLIFADRPKTVSGDHLTYNYTFIVFAPHGPIWKSLRRLTFSEIFSQKALQRSAFVREEEARHFVGRLLKCTAGGNKPKLDMKYMLSLLTSSVIMRVAAGKRYVAVSDEDTEEEKRLMQEFKDLFFPIVSTTPCDFIPLLRMIGFKGIEKSIIQLGKKREVFLNKLLVEVRARRRADAEKRLNGEKPNAVVDTLLNLQETDPEFYTDDIIKGIITMMFIAGTETSTATLEWALTLLLQHPEKMEKLRAEIDGVVGDTRLVNESDFSKLPYLKAVVKETMRLYPPSPLLLPRYSSEACTIGGYYVPKGTILLVNVWTMHRDPKLWDEPNEFKPERFMEGDLDGYLYQPFGYGRRICPGAGMGTHIVCETLGMLVQCFDWDQIGMDEDMTHLAGAASMSKNKPLEASFAPRSEMAKVLSQF